MRSWRPLKRTKPRIDFRKRIDSSKRGVFLAPLFFRLKKSKKPFFDIARFLLGYYHLVARWEKVVKTLFGKFNRSLDEKGRLLIPSKLLSSEDKVLYVLRGFDGCLSVYREEAFERFLEGFQAMDYRNEEQRAYVRLAASSINEMKIDSHGRILLGKQTLEEYAIGQDVTIIGALDHFEIWDSTAFASYLIRHGGAFDRLGIPSKGNRS